MPSFTHLDSYKKLQSHYESVRNIHMRDMFENDMARAWRYFLKECALNLDYSKNRINDETLRLLFDLARERDLSGKIEAMFSGKKINSTENRAALHTALRNQSADSIVLDGIDIMPKVCDVLERMGRFSDSIRSGEWKGYTDKSITDVVNIGIGGSDLGALMVCKALKNFGLSNLKMHFVSNVDGIQLQSVLDSINAESSLFIVASKTFSTQETLTNALSARAWFLHHAKDEIHIARHFVAVSTNKNAVQEFGIDLENMFEFWEWVGGRYSLWSAIGLSIMIFLGKENFSLLLKGAYQMDLHFKTAPFESNMPVILALLGIWYINFFDAGSHIIAPYDSVLRYFPKFIQQLDMESNGKSVQNDGTLVDYDTGPIIWGDMGINAQHAFFQLLHQGTHLSPIDLIASLSNKGAPKEHHEILLSNVIAQAQAFMRGKTLDEVRSEMAERGFSSDRIENLAPHRVFSGNRPSNVILIDEITPQSIGSLIALYEHKIFVQGVIWDINSFDQWGVELGKELTENILRELQGEKSTNTDYKNQSLQNLKNIDGNIDGQDSIKSSYDSSTAHLILLYKQFNWLQ